MKTLEEATHSAKLEMAEKRINELRREVAAKQEMIDSVTR